jgi:ribosomal protein S18 acetylase RimI-like enzyme
MKVQFFNKVDNVNELSKIVFLDFIQLKNQTGIEYSQKAIQQTLSSRSLIGWFLLNDDNKTVGYLFGKSMRLNDGRLVYFMDYFFIIPEYRGNKLGKTMLLECIKYITKNNIQFIMLITKINELAYNMYKKLGFQKEVLIKFDNPNYELLTYYCF